MVVMNVKKKKTSLICGEKYVEKQWNSSKISVTAANTNICIANFFSDLSLYTTVSDCRKEGKLHKPC